MARKCDVLVVGAGPAGVSAAFFLKHLDSKCKFNVTLAEKLGDEKYSNYHRMCGEAISNSAFEEISPIKPFGVISKIRTIEENYPEDQVVSLNVKGYVINRPVFFKKIISAFEKLDGYFVNDCVSSVKSGKNKAKVTFSDGKQAEYDYVVATDGAVSSLRNQAFAGKFNVKPFVQYLVKSRLPKDKITFIYGEKYKGDYKWIFPSEGNTAKRGFPLGAEPIPEGIIAKQARTIGFGGIKHLVKGRLLFAGDSACMTNPVTKGGIRPAMVAGKLAAEAIVKGRPLLYEKNWKATPFASDLPLKAFDYLKDMRDKDLAGLIRRLNEGRPSNKDLVFAEAFEVCNKYGW